MSVAELAERAQEMTQDEINELEMKNVNNYLFNVAELEERNMMRFESIRIDYYDKKDLLKSINNIHKIKGRKPNFDDLNRQLQVFFLDEAKEERKKDYGETD